MFINKRVKRQCSIRIDNFLKRTDSRLKLPWNKLLDTAFYSHIIISKRVYLYIRLVNEYRSKSLITSTVSNNLKHGIRSFQQILAYEEYCKMYIYKPWSYDFNGWSARCFYHQFTDHSIFPDLISDNTRTTNSQWDSENWDNSIYI